MADAFSFGGRRAGRRCRLYLSNGHDCAAAGGDGRESRLRLPLQRPLPPLLGSLGDAAAAQGRC